MAFSDLDEIAATFARLSGCGAPTGVRVPADRFRDDYVMCTPEERKARARRRKYESAGRRRRAALREAARIELLTEGSDLRDIRARR